MRASRTAHAWGTSLPITFVPVGVCHAAALASARARSVLCWPWLTGNRNGGIAIDSRTTRHPGHGVSQRRRKRIEQCFGWGKLIDPIRQVMVQGLDKVDQLLTLTMAAYNLRRSAHPGAIAPAVRPMSGGKVELNSSKHPNDRETGRWLSIWRSLRAA